MPNSPLLVFAVLLPLSAFGQELEPGQQYLGSQICQGCHPEVWDDFHRNPHFKSIASGKEDQANTGCEGCHGPAGLHVIGGGDTSKIFRFPEVEPAAVLDRCLNCHSKDFGKMQIRRSSHSTGEVSCISCHSIHEPQELGPLLAKQEREVCYTCHLEVRARFDMPFKHRVNEGAIDCSDCHNPHGSAMATWATAHSPRMVSQAFGNDLPCTKCHTDKRGPFVHEHPPVRVEGCPTCHNPHGSTNPRLLNRPAVFTMCLECHSDIMGFGTRGEQIPGPSRSFHNLGDPSFQNCVTCHARIHGSNVDSLFRR